MFLTRSFRPLAGWLVSSALVLGGCGSDAMPGSGDAGSLTADGGSEPRADASSLPRPDAGPPAACDVSLSGSGDATYYDATGAGACGFPPQSGGGLFVAAMNAPQFDGSAVCGMCARVSGPMGEVTVRIVDLCPECASGDLDLSPDAFERIAALAEGRVPITWAEVPCEVSGPLVYHFAEGSNPWWTGVQVRNHRHRVASLEARREDGSWAAIARTDYNYFVDAEGLGEGPYALRVTDVHGHVVVDEGVPGLDDADAVSAGQLAACE